MRCRNVLKHFDAIMDIMLPTLREERRKTYSPVLPISETSGVVLQVPVEVVDAEAGIIRFEDDGKIVEQMRSGRQVQAAMEGRLGDALVALGVDYEMSGKDLTDSVTQSGKIVRALGGRPPEGMIYELFLDENGEKISKSKGNGLTIDEWLNYGTEESLGFYLFREPKSAKQPASRRDPARGRRILAVPLQDTGTAARTAARQSGVALAARQRLQGRGRGQPAGDLWPAAQPRRRAGHPCHA